MWTVFAMFMVTIYICDSSSICCSHQVDFDRTKHLSDKSIRHRRMEREKLIALEKEREERVRREREAEIQKREEERWETLDL